MRFQKKILIHYITFLAVSVAAITMVYCYSSWRRYESEEHSRLQAMAGQMVQQLELRYSSMEEAGEALLSDRELLDALRILNTVPADSSYREDAKKQVIVKLNTYYIVKRYYRVVIYNDAGDVFASYDFDDRKIVDVVPKGQDIWTRRADELRGKTVVIPPHEDLWGLYDKSCTYGLLRGAVGYGAYLEVQQTEDILKQIFNTYDDNIKVMAMLKEGELFYRTADQETASRYGQMGLEGKTGAFRMKDPQTGKREVVSAVCSDLTGMTILLIEDSRVMMQKMSGFLALACSVLLLFTGGFTVFIYYVSKKMAEPVNELRQRMEHITADNVEESICIENSIDEIKALSNAYGQVIKRLKESLMKEKSLSYLQLQAHYDLLQAQINPHFFYNVLNVLSARGLSVGDETICEICDSLSGMFRYATGNRMRYAGIEEEMGYVEKYLYLMKLRYQHKLEYRVQVAESIGTQKIPKIVFQPIVENSIKHGFGSGQGVMKISIEGRINEDERQWEMVFKDNGGGISQETVQEIEKNMARMKRALKDNDSSIEMEFGGMGLLNTYARLVLFFGDDVRFSIRGDGEGTEVVIAARMARGDHERSETKISKKNALPYT